MRSLTMFTRAVEQKITFLIILLTFMGFFPLRAQEGSAMPAEPMVLETLTIDEGLSQNFVTAILQDRRGYLWFGTRDGLNKYDGYRFTIYRHDPYDSTSISFNRISALYEDKAGRLWIGTTGGGLNLFERETEQFHRFVHDPQDANSLSDDRITAIVEGRSGEIWIGTQAGLNRLVFSPGTAALPSGRNGATITRYTHNPANSGSLKHNFITAILADSAGTVWMGTPSGLHKLEAKRGGSSQCTAGPTGELEISSIYQDQKGMLWMVTGNSAEVIGFEPSTEKMTSYSMGYKNDRDAIIKIVGGRAVPSRPGGRELWLVARGYLASFSPATGTVKKFSLQFRVMNTLVSDYFLTSVCQDNGGLLWVGTNGRGVGKYDPAKQQFDQPLKYLSEAQGLKNLSVRSLYRDRSGAILIGTTLRKTYRFEPYAGQIQEEKKLDGMTIYAMLEDRRGSFWFGAGPGLHKYDPKPEGTVQSWLDLRPAMVIAGFCPSLYEDQDGRVWFQHGNALAKFEPATKRIIEFPTPFALAPDPQLYSGTITAIKQDGAGVFWLGSNVGLIRFDPETKVFKQYRHQPGNLKSLSYDHIWSLHISSRDSGKTIWIGTDGGGLNRFDPATETFAHYTEKDGLANNVVYGILEDETGNLWMSTNKGISRLALDAVEGFTPNAIKRRDSSTQIKNAFRNFDVHDGLQSNEFNSFAYYKAADGEMLFGGINGFNAFYPEKIRDNEHIPPIVFTDFLLAQNSVSFKTSRSSFNSFEGKSGPLTKPVSELDAITLSYRDNIFAFEFAALDFASPPKNRYAYKMENFQEDWIEAGTHRVATFTNLDPGEYVLRVKASNNDGIWNEKGAAIRITITPPWWRTKVAYALYALLLVAGFFALDRVQQRRVIQRERARAQLREAELVHLQAEELETMDHIVRIINRESVLENVLRALLEQGMKLFPQAEKAVALIYDHRKNHFKLTAGIGYDPALLQETFFSLEEITARYATNAEEVERGIYVLRHLQQTIGSEKLQTLHLSKSFLAMAVAVDGKLEAFLVFDSVTHDNAFDRPDARKLIRLRSHATAAIAKAKTLRELEEKNAEIIRTQQQLITQEKLASLGQLTTGIAHEIKNPLNFVTNFAALTLDLTKELRDLLDAKYDKLDAETKSSVQEVLRLLDQNLAKINEHGRRADSIVKGMLLHSRGESGERRPADLNAILDEYVMLAFHGMRAQDNTFNIKIEKDYDPAIGRIEVFPQDLSRVFLNLVNNACYATHEKKKALGEKYSPVLTVRTKNLGDKIEILIRDNGTGIPEHARTKIFHPFFTTKPAGQGTGLGLSISYDIIVQEHHGEIKVETEEGEFTEFVVRLPRA